VTPRERFLASVLGGPVDRFFRYEHGVWPSTRERWLAEGLPGSVGCYPDAPGFTEHFGFDPVTRIHVVSGYTECPFLPAFEREVVAGGEGSVTYRDTDGVVKRVLSERGDTSMPQFLRFPVAGRADWEAVKHRLDPADAAARVGDPAAVKAACADPSTPTLLPLCGAFGLPRNLMGDEGLAYALYDDPDLVHEILACWRLLYVRLLEELTARVRVDAILLWEDLCYKTGPLIGPDQFRRFMLPEYLRLVARARELGVQCVMVDSDGDVSKMIPVFLEAGADCLMPFEVQAGMDVVGIRRRFGGSFCVMGGLDKRALTRGAAAIRAEVERVLPFFKESGRFIPTLDHTVPVDVPLSAFREYLEAVRSYEGGAPP
jgi:uroporphyrinogen-III decarboxylase